MTWEEALYWSRMCRQAMLGVNTDYCLVVGRPAPSYVIVLYDNTHTPMDVFATPGESRHYIDQCITTRWQRRFSINGVKELFGRHT